MRNIFLFLLLSMATVANAAHPPVKGLIQDNNKAPLFGANVYWLGTTSGATTNEKGEFEIHEVEGADKLVVSYIGYDSDTIMVGHTHEKLIITLGGTVDLGEVLVAGRAVGTVTARGTTIQTQKITYAELCRAACCNLGESFETNPSVDVSYSDAVTGARQIQLLGLSGKYVQMLTENIPNFRGASSAYGLSYVPGSWMESIQVSKGTSSVKNGYEALTGQINVEYKKPRVADPLSVSLFASDALRMEANVDGHYNFSPNVGGSLFLHYSNDKKKHDANGDGFLDQPQTEQINLINRWYFNKGNYAAQVGVKFLNEKRENGQVLSPESSAIPYKIGINTNRGEVYTKQAYIFEGDMVRSLALIANWSTHDQKSVFGRRDYDVLQNNLYLSMLYEGEINLKHSISAGLSLNYDQTKDALKLPPLTTDRYTPFDNNRKETTTGAYVQYTYKPIEKITLMGGLRGDYHNEYGGFITPRFHLKYDILERLHFRGSVGKGYRSVNVWAENNYLFASNRIGKITEALKMEDAVNYGVNLTGYVPIADRDLTITAEWYYTNFLNQVVTDMDSNPHSILFYNLNGKSFAGSTQIEANYQIFRGFTLTAAYRWTNAKTTYNGVLREKPLTNRSKGLVTASYQTPLQKWQFDFTTQFNGGGRMPDPDLQNPLWDKEFKPFTIMNAQVTRFFKTWSVYVGAENLANFRQEHPIIDPSNPFGDNFDATMVWGPVHGRKFYVGVRWAIPSKE